MRRTVLAVLALVGAAAAGVPGRGGDGQEAAKSEGAVKSDLNKMQGLWQYEALEEDGKVVPARSLRRRTVFFGGGSVVMKDDGEMVQAAQVSLDAKAPGAIDFRVIAGPYRNITMLGIYELKGNTLKVCFDRAGRERPKEFKTSADSGLFLAVYKRERGADEPDITGTYDCAGTEMDGNNYKAQVEIQRLGNAYSVTWAKGGGLMAVGVGLRKNNVLSVSFANKGLAGIAVYQIGKDRKMEGEWTEVGGIGVLRAETLTPKETAAAKK